jgi:hypothetical protein
MLGHDDTAPGSANRCRSSACWRNQRSGACMKKHQLDHILRAAGDSGDVRGLCLEPHDLAISKYVAHRDKDRIFTRELARRGLVDREKLLALVEQTPIPADIRERIRADIASDFASSGGE